MLVCNVRNVLVNNLSGSNTRLLIDRVHLYNSVSSVYGLESVSAEGLERIDVSREACTSPIELCRLESGQRG